MDDNLTQQDVTRLKRQAKAILDSESEEMLHNQVIHQRILETWKQQRPTMWKQLEEAGVGAALAVVLQQRMWEHRDLLISSGMQANEARAIAEREHLMLTPEDED